MAALDTPIERRTVLKAFLVAGPTLTVAVRLGLGRQRRRLADEDRRNPGRARPHRQHRLYAATDDLRPEVRDQARRHRPTPNCRRWTSGRASWAPTPSWWPTTSTPPSTRWTCSWRRPTQKWGAAQLTGGSNAVRILWDPVRVVAAQMRGQLMAAASQQMGVPVTPLRTEDGHVVATDGQRALLRRALRRRGPAAHGQGGHAEDSQGLQDHRAAAREVRRRQDRPGQVPVRHGPFTRRRSTCRRSWPWRRPTARPSCRSTTRRPRPSPASSPSRTSPACPTA